jgi:hypothetical protein
LGAFVAMRAFRNTNERQYLALCSLMLGGSMWTKNEGIVLSLIFILFHIRTFLNKGNLVYIFKGFILPVLFLLIFKLFYAPQNDIVGGLGADQIQKITDSSRYQLIYDSLVRIMNEYYPVFKWLLIFYILLHLFIRQWLPKEFFLLIVCLLCLLLTYIVSPHNLEWHLNTSLARILVQLIPAFLFVMNQTFSREIVLYRERLET